MAGLHTEGFEVKPLEDIQDEIAADLKSAISPNLDTDAASPLGQLIGVFSSQLRQVWEALGAVYGSQYPDSASGFSLTSVASLTGTNREAATYSIVTATVDLDAGTYLAGTLVAHVTDDPESRFVNQLPISIAVPTVGQTPFIAETPGPVRANAGTLTVIAEPVSGWNSITNAADAVLGELEESDTDLRLRRAVELARRGSTTVEAIGVDIADVEGVTSFTVLENDTDTTDGNGLLPHSVHAYVLGGTDAAVALALFNAKAAGIGTNGSTSVTVADSYAINHTVKFSRPTVKDISIEVTLTALAGVYSGDDAVKEALADYGDENLGVGEDVIRSTLIGVLFGAFNSGIAGVIDVTVMNIGIDPASPGAANAVMTVSQIADLDTSRITVTSSLIAGPP